MSIAETRNFYRGSSVIHRISEFCGVPHEEAIKLSVNGESLSSSRDIYGLSKKFDSEYLVAFSGRLLKERGDEKEFVQNYGLGWILGGGFDMFRSVWDKKSTLGIIDVEYLSENCPGEVFSRQEDVFWKMEPFYQCLKDTMMSYGIRPLTIATGQGYHFDFKVSKNSKHHKSLEELAHVEPTLIDKYRHVTNLPRFSRTVDDQEGRGFEGMGKIIEFILHKAVKRSSDYNLPLPLAIGEIPGNNEKREAINLDLSAFCDPLYMRTARVPFSSYHKHKVYHWKVGEWVTANIPVQIAVPRYTPFNNNELLMHELFDNRRNFHNSANYAGAIKTDIPESGDGVERVIADYKRSELFKFHRDFDRTQHDSPEHWNSSYDKYHGQDHRVEHMLNHPAPALLKPNNIQYLTGKLMLEGWHPKHIAGLIRSKYERDHGWSSKEGGKFNFHKYDAAAHANKWVRFYSGLIHTQLDWKLTRA